MCDPEAGIVICDEGAIISVRAAIESKVLAAWFLLTIFLAGLAFDDGEFDDDDAIVDVQVTLDDEW